MLANLSYSGSFTDKILSLRAHGSLASEGIVFNCAAEGLSIKRIKRFC